MDTSKLRINGARLRASLEEMAKIGATPAGGCSASRCPTRTAARATCS